MFRAAIDARTELGRRVEPILAAGELVPDELTIGLIRERLTEPTPAAGFVLDGFPRNEAQSDALDELLRELDRELDAILFFDLSGRRRHRPDARARRRGGPHRRHARGDRAPARRLPLEDRAGRRALPRRPASSSRCTPTGAPTRSGSRSSRRSTRSGARAMIIRKSAARDRADGARRRGRRRHARADARSGSSRASRWPSSTASPTSTSASQGGVPTSKGYKGYPGRDVHLAERDDRPRHPGRVPRRRRATSSRSTSASRRTA